MSVLVERSTVIFSRSNGRGEVRVTVSNSFRLTSSGFLIVNGTTEL